MAAAFQYVCVLHGRHNYKFRMEVDDVGKEFCINIFVVMIVSQDFDFDVDERLEESDVFIKLWKQ